MGLSPQEAALIARSELRFSYELCPWLISYGIYLSIFPYSLVILCRKTHKTAATYALLVLNTMLFTTSTLQIACGIATMDKDLLAYPTYTSVPYPQQNALRRDVLAPINSVNVVAQGLSLVLADTIVMWRAWVLYPHSRLARYLMAFTVVTNSILKMSFDIISAIGVRAYASNPQSFIALNVSSTLLSFCTNALATGFIAFRAWKHRKELRIHGFNKRSKTENLLILLIETGAAYSLVQLVNVLMAIFDLEYGSAIDKASGLIFALTLSAAGIFPTLIIIVAGRNQSSVMDTSLSIEVTPSDVNRNGVRCDTVFTTIHFAEENESTTRQASQNTAASANRGLSAYKEKDNTNGEGYCEV